MGDLGGCAVVRRTDQYILVRAKPVRGRLYVPAEVAAALVATARAAGVAEAAVIEAALVHWSRLDIAIKQGLVRDYLACGTRKRKEARGGLVRTAIARLGGLVGWPGRRQARAA